MRQTQDARFRRERAQYRLRFCCESCVHFDPERERCGNGYPTDEHRRARYREAVPGAGWAALVFCKDYELA